MQIQQPDKQPNKQPNLDVEELWRKITSMDRSIKRNPYNHNAYSLKGQYLIQLAKVSGIHEYSSQALDSLTHAVDLETDNTYYLCDRAKLHAYMGNFKMAVRDFMHLGQLCQNQKENDILKDFYVKITLTALGRLSEIREITQSLRAKNQLPADFLDAFDHFRNVTEGRVVSVGNQSTQIQELLDIIRFLQVRIHNNQEVTDAEIQRFKGILTRYNKELQQNTKQLAQVQETLDQSRVKDKATLLKSFQELELTDPKLFYYAQAFYSMVLSLFRFDESLIEDETTQKASDKGFYRNQSLFLDSTNTSIDITINEISESLQRKTQINRARIFKEIRKKFEGEDDFSIMVGKLTLALVLQEGKKTMIKQTSSDKVFPKICFYQKSCIETSLKCNKQAERLIDSERDIPVALATQDVTLLISYILTNSETIITTQEPLDVLIEKAITEDKINRMFVKMGVGGICDRCQGLLQPRNGKKSAKCYDCAKSTQGGVKCSSCKIKKCKPCARL